MIISKVWNLFKGRENNGLQISFEMKEHCMMWFTNSTLWLSPKIKYSSQKITGWLKMLRHIQSLDTNKCSLGMNIKVHSHHCYSPNSARCLSPTENVSFTQYSYLPASVVISRSFLHCTSKFNMAPLTFAFKFPPPRCAWTVNITAFVLKLPELCCQPLYQSTCQLAIP